MTETILVVDDEPDVRGTLKDVMEDEGYRVVEVQNGQEALDYLSMNPAPCLVLLDLMMPVLSGFQFLEAVKDKPELETSVVIVSAAANEKVAAAAKNPAVAGVLHKPVQLMALLNAVERYC